MVISNDGIKEDEMLWRDHHVLWMVQIIVVIFVYCDCAMFSAFSHVLGDKFKQRNSEHFSDFVTADT